ncbi:MAG: hypothetical protein K6T91_11540 [Firmicutes bacterium]|nr:hypothetical protein [Bacillota bacterium]
MKEANQKRIIRIINFLIIASLISSNIYFYNQSNSFFKETQILGNMLAMEKERHSGIAVGFFKTDCVPCMEELYVFGIRHRPILLPASLAWFDQESVRL